MNQSINSTNDQSSTNANGLLIFVRHGESEWNSLGKWTGLTDVHITDMGRRASEQVGHDLKDIRFDYAFTSPLIRTKETLQEILKGHGNDNLAAEESAALSERDYGDYTGLNKWEVLEKIGEEEFTGIRRGWNHPIPGGETLEMVYNRAVPFYVDVILPKLKAGHNVLVVSHGNTIRSLIKYIENVSDDDIGGVEMALGETLIYTVDNAGKMTSKEKRQVDVGPTKA